MHRTLKKGDSKGDPRRPGGVRGAAQAPPRGEPRPLPSPPLETPSRGKKKKNYAVDSNVFCTFVFLGGQTFEERKGKGKEKERKGKERKGKEKLGKKIVEACLDPFSALLPGLLSARSIPLFSPLTLLKKSHALLTRKIGMSHFSGLFKTLRSRVRLPAYPPCRRPTE